MQIQVTKSIYCDPQQSRKLPNTTKADTEEIIINNVNTHHAMEVKGFTICYNQMNFKHVF